MQPWLPGPREAAVSGAGGSGRQLSGGFVQAAGNTRQRLQRGVGRPSDAAECNAQQLCAAGQLRPAQGVLRYYIMGILWRISLFRASGYSCTLSLFSCFPPHSSYFRIHALPCMCGAPTRTITTEREGWVGAGRRSLPLHRCHRGRLRRSPRGAGWVPPSLSPPPP